MSEERTNLFNFPIGTWGFSQVHGESVRILDVETVWNHTVYQVWIPRLATIERVPAESLSPIQPTKATGLDRITYAVAAARIADALTQDVLLAPLEAGVIPLPHQLHALTRAVTGDRVRYLLADEVGLGKTIEAGLIFRELKLRGLVKRVLVVAPKGLVTQWMQEMQTHFGEEFRLLTPSEFSSWRNLTGAENVWRQFDQVVCPVDSIKPVERRRGWSREKLEGYNQERLGDLIDAGWDLIICDEAHRLGGSTEQVARYRLGKALAEAAPYLLLLSARLAGLQNEKEEVKLLLDLARHCQPQGPDARAETLLGILYDNQREENNPELKYLIFTEFVPTQNMLRDFLEQHGFSVVCLNGSMDMEERRRVQLHFAEKARILVSTDAGGEGLNLQFAHIVVNYDLPWNPMKIEQRIGRVDRIGQKLPVKAFNLIFEDSVELRVQEVLEEKLATILDEFGVDKTQDVLDSAESGAIFEKLYAQAILNPGDIEKNIDTLIEEVRAQAKEEVAGRSYYGETVLDPALAQQLSSHPLPFWVERMATAYLRSEGGKVQRDLFSYSLEWLDGSRMERVSFQSRDAQERGAATRQPGRRPYPWPRPAVAPCCHDRADLVRAVRQPPRRGCRLLVAVADRSRQPVDPGREDHPDLSPR